MAPKEQTCLGDYFTSSREKGKVGLPLLSVTLNNGIVQRNDLERKTETKITPEEHLLVRKGDIAYNMMRVWQGALGRADSDGIVSPAYVVLRAKKDVDSKYAEYLFNTTKMIYFFWAYSYGITNDRLRLYFNDFKKIPASLPCIAEQKRIAKVLLTWDHALKKTEQLLKNSQQQKKALMQQLLSGNKRLPGCSGKWKTKRLADICSINPPKPSEPTDGLASFISMDSVSEDAKILKSEIRKYSEVSAGFTSFQNHDVLVAKITPCFENGKGAYAFGLKNDIGFGSTEFHVLRAKQGNCSQFIYFLTNTREFRVRGEANMQGSAGQKRVTTSYLKSYKASVPPTLIEQQRIAQILFSADQEIEALRTKLSCLNQEKKALMQQLLTGRRRLKVNQQEFA
ncbi:restriction endonuclease subunit S [Pseudomonas vranovensis]|uniref:restriction endonuclease subunit S n=1 Tax=Pseudomonas vranovensis TaxID=321661 RepID=UPI00041E4D89|nr:restriction endonuclease subunit S [Pseudomonas vranovensis]